MVSPRAGHKGGAELLGGRTAEWYMGTFPRWAGPLGMRGEGLRRGCPAGEHLGP